MLSLFFAGDFFVPFLLFFTVDFDAAVEELCTVAGAAAGLAAVCAAKVKGSEAAVRAIVSKVVFIFFSQRAFSLSPAHNPMLRFYAPNSDSLRRLSYAPN